MNNEIETSSRRLPLRAITAAVIGLITFGIGAGIAGAVPPTVPADPTAGQMDVVQTSVQTWVLTYGVPVLFGLLLLGVLIRIGTKWFRRAAKAV